MHAFGPAYPARPDTDAARRLGRAVDDGRQRLRTRRKPLERPQGGTAGLGARCERRTTAPGMAASQEPPGGLPVVTASPSGVLRARRGLVGAMGGVGSDERCPVAG